MNVKPSVLKQFHMITEMICFILPSELLIFTGSYTLLNRQVGKVPDWVREHSTF
jgi:hypothetical protein